MSKALLSSLLLLLGPAGSQLLAGIVGASYATVGGGIRVLTWWACSS